MHCSARGHQPGPGRTAESPGSWKQVSGPGDSEGKAWGSKHKDQDPRVAVFFPQLDWYAWVPNAPCTMRMPPPTTKEEVKMATVMGSLPDVRQACLQMTITWHLGRRQPDMVRGDPGKKGNYSWKGSQSEESGSTHFCLQTRNWLILFPFLGASGTSQRKVFLKPQGQGCIKPIPNRFGKPRKRDYSPEWAARPALWLPETQPHRE